MLLAISVNQFYQYFNRFTAKLKMIMDYHNQPLLYSLCVILLWCCTDSRGKFIIDLFYRDHGSVITKRVP